MLQGAPKISALSVAVGTELGAGICLFLEEKNAVTPSEMSVSRGKFRERDYKNISLCPFIPRAHILKEKTTLDTNLNVTADDCFLIIAS